MKQAWQLLVAIPGVLALVWVASILVEGFGVRAAYGFDIEWMEGGMLVHALRLQQGQGLYTVPTAEWVPYIYPPLYAWLLSLVEPTYEAGRTLSAIGSAAAAAALIAAARQERLPWGYGAGAAALFLSCYENSGTFYDLVRIDGLAIGLAAWAMVLVRRATVPAVVAGGLLLAAAFATKHSYAALGLPMILWLWRYNGGRVALAFLAASAGPALLFTGAVQLASDGLFLTYLLEVPGAHPLVGQRAWPNFGIEVWKALKWACVGASVAALVLLRAPLAIGVPLALLVWMLGSPDPVAHAAAEVAGRLDIEKTEALGVVSAPVLAWLVATFLVRFPKRPAAKLDAGAGYWVGLALVVLPLTALMRAHHGGFINVLMPAHWIVALACVYALGRLRGGALVGACIVAFTVYEGRWDVDRYLPTDADTEAGELLLDKIASYEGEVLMPHAPWYPHLVGKQPSFPLIALWDIEHKQGPLFDDRKALDKAMKAKKWDAIIVSKEIKHGMQRHYERAGQVKMKSTAFRTRTGWRVRPNQVWEPKATN